MVPRGMWPMVWGISVAFAVACGPSSGDAPDPGPEEIPDSEMSQTPDSVRETEDRGEATSQEADDRELAPSVATIPDELVWFAPNMGSGDYTDLFTRLDDWAEARSAIDVFKFYAQNALEHPCEICGDNTLDAFVSVDAFGQLAETDTRIALEVGAVKEWGCTGHREAEVALEAIGNVERHGGSVDLLAMDEPLLGGQRPVEGRACGYDMEQSAAATVRFLDRVGSARPDLPVGLIEPYPHYSVEQLKDWVVELETRGASLAFFHLDVDIHRVEVEGQDVVGDLRALEAFCAERGIPFGVILISDWQQAHADRAYFESTLDWTRTVDEAIGRPDHVIFQSWHGPAEDGTHRYPSNLPEDDAAIYSHTRLVLEGLDLFAGGN